MENVDIFTVIEVPPTQKGGKVVETVEKNANVSIPEPYYLD